MTELAQEVLGTFHIVDELKQRHVEAFFAYMKEHEAGEQITVVYNRLAVEAAIKAGILLDEIDTQEASPALIYWLGMELLQRVVKSREIPDAKN